MNRPGRLKLRVVVAAAVAAGAILMVAVPAHAGAPSTLDIVGTHIYFTASAGAQNHLVISRHSWPHDAYRFTDFSSTPIALSNPACWYSGDSDVTLSCIVPGLTMIHVSTLDGRDTILNYTDSPIDVAGGDGDDSIMLGGRPATTSIADGGDGDDWISSGPGEDSIDGGAGTDTLGFDGVDPVNASLVTGLAWRSSDTDTFTSIENLIGTGGSDTLTGNSSANVLDGGIGSACDPLPGCTVTSGDDRIFGGGGNDKLKGQAGADRLYGGTGKDILWGGDGDDQLLGEADPDVLYGEAGNDTCTGEVVLGCEVVRR